MTPNLEMHAASPDETVAAHRNVFDIWSKGLSLKAHVRLRLTSPKHRLATWFVGCVQHRVVVSLGAYPLRFRIRGEEVPGIAIGSVYTLEEFRRRGFAAQLLAWVEDQFQRKGTVLSLLYSDIKPDYYANMGYLLCPSFEGWRDVCQQQDKADVDPQFVEIDAASHRDKLMNLYADYHGAAPLSIARDAAYWQALLQRFTDEQFYAVIAKGHGDWCGYLRLSRKDPAWRITDYALADRSPKLHDEVLTSAAALAAESGAQRVGGWLPDIPSTRKLYELAPRQTEITMIKSLSTRHPLDDEFIAATDHFCEIDHV